MVRRSSPNQLQSIDDVQRLQDMVVDKRFDKRAKAKKHRRNRHYEKLFMRHAVNAGLLLTEHPDAPDANDAIDTHFGNSTMASDPDTRTEYPNAAPPDHAQ